MSESTPLGSLISKIKQMIIEKGYTCVSVEVRFERGVFESKNSYWHLDGLGLGKDPITVCWSTREKWTTWIIDENTKIHNSSFLERDFSKKELELVEAFGKPSATGNLYHVAKLWHRAPLISDLGEDSLTSIDYRLFMRFHGSFSS
ncbi:MAG: hypothetical protein H7A37_05550 [Chlamydiales bacterium]|nr:hypothetical protein [Chlamydiales bacterium]